MSQITSGRVVFSRTVQPASYKSARAEVELAFVLAEGEDPAAAIDEAGALVREKALEVVGAAGPARDQRRRFRARNVDDD